MKREYYRHLPHQIPAGFPIFLTWNLKGALPKDVIEQLKREQNRLSRQPRRPDEAPRERAIRQWKLLFAQSDQFLDRSGTGPQILGDPDASKCVENEILLGARELYTLWAWCIMSNHVHVLLTPHIVLAKITQRLKGTTSRKINHLQGMLGRTVWQDESYDHWARDEEETLRIIAYIENNPVKAALCKYPADWPCSSARLRTNWPMGTPYVGQASA
jgi:putative transposase